MDKGHEDDRNAYLPTPEEIDRVGRELRQLHLAEKRKQIPKDAYSRSGTRVYADRRTSRGTIFSAR